MRRRAFLVFVCGMFVLFLFFIRDAREVESLDGLDLNSRVVVSGKVVDEVLIYSGTRLLELDSGIVAICKSSEVFLNFDVRIEGIVSDYEWKRQIDVERIFIIH